MAGYFELKNAANGKFSFNLKAGNHEVILSSQSYESKKSAEGGVASVQKNSQDDARYERKTAKDGSTYFTLNATNGQVIGKSEMYSSASSMENGIKSVKTNGSTTVVKDLTTG